MRLRGEDLLRVVIWSLDCTRVMGKQHLCGLPAPCAFASAPAVVQALWRAFTLKAASRHVSKGQSSHATRAAANSKIF